MRGKEARSIVGIVDSGITPAHAGKSEIRALRFGIHQDHPRTCGEKIVAARTKLHSGGSPPHMRGKVLHLFQRVSGKGITPAHAGKRPKRGRSSTRIWDHPRTCGEKNFAVYFKHISTGSPPHMRGKVTVCCDGNDDAGITPAHAGKSNEQLDFLTTGKDHPRTCGEKTKKIP